MQFKPLGRRYLALRNTGEVTCKRDFNTVLSTRFKTRAKGPFEGLGQMEGPEIQVCPSGCPKTGQLCAPFARISGRPSLWGRKNVLVVSGL